MGEPTRGNARVLPPEHIGRAEATGGTETSKYPEEEKSTEIPGVAASGTGRRANRRRRHSFGALARRCRGTGRPGAQDPGRGDKAAAQPNITDSIVSGLPSGRYVITVIPP